MEASCWTLFDLQTWLLDSPFSTHRLIMRIRSHAHVLQNHKKILMMMLFFQRIEKVLLSGNTRH